MRYIILVASLLCFSLAQAQPFLPGSFVDNHYRGNVGDYLRTNDTASSKKWFFTHYTGLSTSFTFSKAGSATVVAAPMGIQLNRRLNNNLYAFAGVSVAPAYVSFNRSFMATDFNKSNANTGFFKSGSLGVYSRAELGLQYINDERTFSISGSIGIERSSYPMPFYNQSATRLNQSPEVSR
jgi:hypothetical protein